MGFAVIAKIVYVESVACVATNIDLYQLRVGLYVYSLFDTCEFVVNGWIILHGTRCDRQSILAACAAHVESVACVATNIGSCQLRVKLYVHSLFDTCESVANGWIILHGIRCDRQDLFLSTAQWAISEHNFGNGSQYKDNTSQRPGCRSA